MSAVIYATLRHSWSGRTTRLRVQGEDKGHLWVPHKNFKAAQARIGGGPIWSDLAFITFDKYGPRHLIEQRAA